jgi:aminopeptidase S
MEAGDGSDHAPFAAAGIPVGGLFAGVKPTSQGEQEHHGGMIDAAAADPCYHRACDDLGNLDPVALDQMADAAAHALMRFAWTQRSSIDGRPTASRIR